MQEASEFEQSLRGLLARDRVAMIEDRDQEMYERGQDKLQDSLVAHFIDRADCAADNMEGADGDDFTRFETRMVCAIETLKELGVIYDPITGTKKMKP